MVLKGSWEVFVFRVGIGRLHGCWSLGDRYEVWLLLIYDCYMCLGQSDAVCLSILCVWSLFPPPLRSEHLTAELCPGVQILSLVPGVSLTNLRLGLVPCSSR